MDVGAELSAFTSGPPLIAGKKIRRRLTRSPDRSLASIRVGCAYVDDLIVTEVGAGAVDGEEVEVELLTKGDLSDAFKRSIDKRGERNAIALSIMDEYIVILETHVA